ncbi:hypothetical protein OCOL_000908 [Ordospora colligata]
MKLLIKWNGSERISKEEIVQNTVRMLVYTTDWFKAAIILMRILHSYAADIVGHILVSDEDTVPDAKRDCDAANILGFMGDYRATVIIWHVSKIDIKYEVDILKSMSFDFAAVVVYFLSYIDIERVVKMLISMNDYTALV